MAYTKQHDFDEEVVRRINAYIKENDLSYQKIAEETGLTYQQLYQLLHFNRIIKLREYTLLCEAFQEPLGYFTNGINTKGGNAT